MQRQLIRLFGGEAPGQTRHNHLMFERTLLVQHARRVRSSPLALSVPVWDYELFHDLTVVLVAQIVCKILVILLSFLLGLVVHEAVHRVRLSTTVRLNLVYSNFKINTENVDYKKP